MRDGHPCTAPVGSFPAGASPYGALDMAGNVWEGCEGPYDARAAGDAPSRASVRVARGGGWCSPVETGHAAFRRGFDPATRWAGLGFRPALTAP